MQNKIKWLLFIFMYNYATFAQEYVIVKAVDGIAVNNATLSTTSTKNKVLNINCYTVNQPLNQLLIHGVIFSDDDGNFKEKVIKKSTLKNSKCIDLLSLFQLAKKNTQLDQNREITYFEFENNQTNFFTQTNAYKIIVEKTDSTYTLYDNETTTFFYEIKEYKQFTPFQTCASIINANAIKQLITRNNGRVFEPEINFPIDDEGDYFPNKIFLEKVNNDGSYHYVRFKKLCHDCSNNYNFEFDFLPNKGITAFWYYLPNKPIKQHIYIKFEKLNNTF